jgi:hypothetical protein
VSPPAAGHRSPVMLALLVFGAIVTCDVDGTVAG